MITIATYQKEEDAHLEAARLREMGVEVHVVHGGASGWMPYVQSAVELQIDPADLEKLEQCADEFLEGRKRRCPHCGSARYIGYTSSRDILFGLITPVTGLLERGQSATVLQDSREFRCRDCRERFSVNLND